jgi:hypothetical protein
MIEHKVYLEFSITTFESSESYQEALNGASVDRSRIQAKATQETNDEQQITF